MSDWSDIGNALRAEREALGSSLKDVSHRTRIPVQTLHELEENDYSSFPSRAYAKSFLAQYSEHLGVDADEWLDQFDTGNVLDNLDSYAYLKDGGERLGEELIPSKRRPDRAKRPAKKNKTVPAPAPAPKHSSGTLQHLVVFLVTAAFITGGVFGFMRLSEKLDGLATETPADGTNAEPSTIGPTPSIIPSRPTRPKRSKNLNGPAPAVAEVVPENGDDIAPQLIIDTPPPRAVIVEE